MLQKIDFQTNAEGISLELDKENNIWQLFFKGKLTTLFQELHEGIYETTSLNPEHLINLISDYEFKRETRFKPLVEEKNADEWRYIESYGVCDNYEQVLQHIPELLSRENKYLVFLTRMSKKNQPPRDGWRWEKWGEYIGNQNSQADYLYDEPEIDHIFIYTICEVQPKKVKVQ